MTYKLLVAVVVTTVLFVQGGIASPFFGSTPSLETIVIGLKLKTVNPADPSVLDFESSINEITNRQYATFLRMVGRGSDKWFEKYGTEPGKLPARDMTKGDALAFCGWLTEIARINGLIDQYDQFNLPTDEQWTAIASENPGDETGSTPEERMQQARSGAYIHGVEPAPRQTDGNVKRKLDAGNTKGEGFEGDSDGYLGVAEVGLFRTKNSIFNDVLGNVEEWIREKFSGNNDCTRGGSCETIDLAELAISHRKSYANEHSSPQIGFRIVLEMAPAK